MLEITNYINFNACTKSEKIIYNFLDSLDEPITNYSAEKLAAYCNCSPASIHRFFIKCGFSGFLDYKYQSLHMLEHQQKSHFNLEFSDNTFAPAIAKIMAAKRIIIFGFATSNITANYLYNKLIKLGLTVFLVNDRLDLMKINHDCAIIISNSGKSRAILSLINSPYDMRKVISITSHNSSLAVHAKLSLNHSQGTFDEHSEEHDEQIHLLMLCYELVKALKNK